MEKLRSVQNIRNKKNRRQAGFTMAELLIVIAIILIVAGFGFVNVIRYQKDLKLKECDDIARQIFIAAQNQLTASDAAGRWKYRLDKSGEDFQYEDPEKAGQSKALIYGQQIPSSSVSSFYPDHSGSDYYYFTNEDISDDTKKLNTMILPFGAIDDTVRTGGKYLITYNADTKTIVSVVYTDDKNVSFRGTTGASTELAIQTITDWNNEQNNGQSKNNRRGRALIGCYGFGEGAFTEGDEVQRPVVWLENAEALVLHVVDVPGYANAADPSARTWVNNIHVILKGAISQQEKKYVIDASNGTTTTEGSAAASVDEAMLPANKAPKDTKIGNNKYDAKEYKLYLDRITKSGGHFADLFPDFIPGEDISVTVYFDKTVNGVLSESKQVTASANSLYRNILTPGAQGVDATDERIAYVANGRHLENLSQEISGVSTAKTVAGGTTRGVNVSEAVLVNDVHWTLSSAAEADAKNVEADLLPDFMNRVKTFYEGDSTVSIYGLKEGSKAAALAENKFYGVVNADIKEFKGNKHRLAAFDIAANKISGNAGIFAESGELIISDLFVTNMTVTGGTTGTQNHAGALIGQVTAAPVAAEGGTASDGVVIKNSGVFYENYSITNTGQIIVSETVTTPAVKTPTTNAWKEESKAAAAGGTDTVETRCITAPAGSAGGLVGSVAAGGKLTIGGNPPAATTDTAISPSAAAAADETRAEENDGSFAAVKISGKTAGGLVGESGGTLTMKNSYSGGHVKKESTALSGSGESAVYAYYYDPNFFNITSTAEDTAQEARSSSAKYAAGGLIGLVTSTGSAAVENCYSTSSVGAEKSNYVWLGGLVGCDDSSSDALSSYKNSYAAGLVDYKTDDRQAAAETAKIIRAGAFAGSVSNASVLNVTTDYKYNSYLSGVNVGLDGVAAINAAAADAAAQTAVAANLKAASDSSDAIKKSGDAANTARAYALPPSEAYAVYPFRSVNQTSPVYDVAKVNEAGEETPAAVQTIQSVHFGDWADSYEYLPVRVVNGNRLMLYVTVPAGTDYISLQVFGSASSSVLDAVEIPAEQIILKQGSSGGLSKEPLNANGVAATPVSYGSFTGSGEKTYAIALDDITDPNGHFKQICENLIPGENIFIFAREGRIPLTENAKRRVAEKIQAAITASAPAADTATEMITEAERNKLETFVTGEVPAAASGGTPAVRRMAVTNSLYGYSDAAEASGDIPAKPAEYTLTTARTETTGTGESSKTTATLSGLAAKVYSIRHLENLSSAVSGVPASAVIKAAQTRDLLWKENLEETETSALSSVTAGTEEDETSLLPYRDFLVKAKEVSPGGIKVSKLPAGAAASGAVHTEDRYLPVVNTGLLSYDGGVYSDGGDVTGVRTIENLPVADGGEGAGLFAQFGSNATLPSGESYAIRNLMIKNVLVEGDNSNALFAGTLAGETVSTNVDNVLVYADRDGSNYNYGDLKINNAYTTGIHVGAYAGAGGLIGSMNGGSVKNSASSVAVMTTANSAGGLIGNINGGSVENSYAGGHTVNGKYSEVKESGTEGASTIYNVAAAAYAGGLVGTAVDGTITNSYATTSVSGTTAGGFVGSPGNAAVTNAYATGLVSGTYAGAFTGTTVSGSSLFYVTGVNAETVKGSAAASTDEGSAVQPMADLALADVTKSDVQAYRYDDSAYALSEYPFTSVKSFSLPGEGTTDNTTGTFVHVGDWEDGYEHVLVVNTSSNS